jgi:hypothetical protein
MKNKLMEPHRPEEIVSGCLCGDVSKRLPSLSSDQGKPEGIVEFLRALYLSFG